MMSTTATVLLIIGVWVLLILGWRLAYEYDKDISN